MRLKVTRSQNAASLYVIKSIYNRDTQSNTSIIVEKLGTEKELYERLNGADPYEWARQYIEKLNKKEKEQQREVILKFSQSKLLPLNEQRFFMVAIFFCNQFIIPSALIRFVPLSLIDIGLLMTWTASFPGSFTEEFCSLHPNSIPLRNPANSLNRQTLTCSMSIGLWM